MYETNTAAANKVTAAIDETSAAFLGRWNRLVSTTNWEKGRIIHEWRQALVDAKAPSAEYSDDAWSRRVGSVTGQHVGRLRRVYERFGGVHQDFSGLYWSHFQAAIDWNDAEMWLEGAIQNRWSVADMRRERWQAFGGLEAERPQENDIVLAEVDEDADMPEARRLGLVDSSGGNTSAFDGSSGPRYDGPDFGDEPESASHQTGEAAIDSADRGRISAVPPVKPFADLPALPDDLSDAFENFKLGILRHKTAGWQEVSCADVIRTLEALKALANAPA
jgi:hypothetical protein